MRLVSIRQFLFNSSLPASVIDSMPHSIEMQWARPSRSSVGSFQRSMRV